MTTIKTWMSSNFGQIPSQTTELAALERLKNRCTYIVVTTLAPSCLIGSSSFLQVMRTTIKARMSTKVSYIGPRTTELAALERLEKIDL